MCIESALLDCVKQQHVELLKQILLSYTCEIDPEQYNRLFNACFELADFIVIADSQQNLNENEIEKYSARYVMQAICDWLDKQEKESCAYQTAVMLIQHAVKEQGRLQQATDLTSEYLESKEGILELMSESTFVTHFQQFSRQ
jgi:hypothetical protein